MTNYAVRVKTSSGWQDLALTGPQGPPGPTGPAGTQGVQGPTGPQGAAGTGINVKGQVPTVGDLPPTGNADGDAYTVAATGDLWIWDTDTSAWINAGPIQGPPGPTGATGAQGPVGPAGAAGATGAPGATGAKGDPGVQGVKGDTGAQGVPGTTGATGAAGAQGPQGVQGDPGAPGATGATGATGAQGPQGIQGPIGPAGSTVASGVSFAPVGNVAATNVQAAIAEVDAEKLPLAGGTLTGDLRVNKSSPAINLDATDTGTASIFGKLNGSSRWLMQLGGGGDAARDFYITRYSDAGAPLDHPLRIERANGDVYAQNSMSVVGTLGFWSGTGGTTGSYYFGNTGNKYLSYDGTSFTLLGGTHALIHSNIWSISAATTGTYYFGNTGTKYLSYDGSNFTLNGGYLRISGGVVTNGGVHLWPLNVKANADSNVGILDAGGSTATFGNLNNAGTAWLPMQTASPWLFQDKIDCNGALRGMGAVHAGAAAPGTGTYYFGYTTSKYLSCSGPTFTLNGGNLVVNSSITATTSIAATGTISSGNGYLCKAGIYGGNSNVFNFFWNTGNALEGWVDATYLGLVAFTSDYRIKKDVIDLPGMWDTVKALRPIKYTQAEFQPPSQKAFIIQQHAEALREAEENPDVAPKEINTAPLFAADDVERWGFIAHELQETLTPSASTGVKDQPDAVQSPNPWTVISALTKALQEAMARIEALEARTS